MSNIIKNNEVSTFGLQSSDIYDNTKIRTMNDERKLCTINGKAQILIQNEQITATCFDKGIMINDYGTVISGPVHLKNPPGDIRINGFWIFNNDLLTTLPSTIYTPIPVLKYKDPPYPKFLKGLSSVVVSV